MIRNLLHSPKLAPLFTTTRFLFCSKNHILKTYLQIIPPHQLYSLKEKKQNRLQQALHNLQLSPCTNGKWIANKEDIKTVLKEVKRRTNLIPLPVLTRIAQISIQHCQSQYSIELKKTYSKIIRTVKYGAEKLNVEQMVELVYKLAKMNKKEYQLMKQVEKILIEDRIPIFYPYIRKIIYSFTHLNQGSSVLYSHISKTLTIGQHQLQPLELSEAAYMLSKVSQNAKGGYGVFKLAEKHVESVLPRMSFSQLVRASSFLLIQNIGSNKFQVKLQQALYNAYPSKDRVKINDFVRLLKATSGYYFKYKEGTLLSILKTTTIRMTQFSTLQQFEDILWSWGRIGKGDRQLWNCLQVQMMNHLPSLKPRQVAFAYYSLCSTHHAQPKVLEAFETKFIEYPLQQLNEHYLIKFLLGMHRRKFYSNTIFSQVSGVVSRKLEFLSSNQLIRFVKILNQSDLDFESLEVVQGVIDSIRKVTDQLQSKLYLLRPSQIAEILFLLIKFQVQSHSLVQKCFLCLDTVIDIPKSVFIKVMFSFTIKQKYQKVIEMLPILEELIKYGPIGYFFSPYEFPLLVFCLFNLEVKGQNIEINRKILVQSEEALNQISLNILNDFVRKGYKEARVLVEEYHNRRYDQQ